MNTVTIDHPHAEVIAAYYSGKAVQVQASGTWLSFTLGHSETPQFSAHREWRIKPEPVICWALALEGGAVAQPCRTRDTARSWLQNFPGARVVKLVEAAE